MPPFKTSNPTKILKYANMESFCDYPASVDDLEKLFQDQ